MAFAETVDIARKAVEAASDKLASDTVMLDTRGVCSFTDYFVICSAESERQMKAICEEVDQALGREGARLLSREGVPSSGWMLMDFGSVIVHVFSPAMREFYQLDKLWSQAQTVVRVQ